MTPPENQALGSRLDSWFLGGCLFRLFRLARCFFCFCFVLCKLRTSASWEVSLGALILSVCLVNISFAGNRN